MKQKINVLSLFDGISVARQALKELKISINKYYASEIDKYCLQISKNNFSDIIQLGNIKKIHQAGGYLISTEKCISEEYSHKLDLIIGGSPCQDLSIAKKNRKGLEGERSSLFYEYVRMLKCCNPKYFILENVASMARSQRDIITKMLYGIEPIEINAALVSAQQRKRFFWVGKLVGNTYEKVEITQPKDKYIFLKDILESGKVDRDKSLYIDANYFKGGSLKNYLDKKRRQVVFKQSESRLMVTESPIRIGQFNKGGQADRVYSIKGKSISLSANGGGRGAKTGLYAVKDFVRKLTPIECERLQSLPDNYTSGVSDTQRYKSLGNAFNCSVIKHILKYLL